MHKPHALNDLNLNILETLDQEIDDEELSEPSHISCDDPELEIDVR